MPGLPEPFEMHIRVRYSETDAMGRLHHANFLNYFEVGRIEQLRSLGQSYVEFEQSGVFLVISKLAVQYHAGALNDDLLRLVTKIVRTTAVRIEHEYELFREQELIASATSTLACVDRDGNVRRLPEWLRFHRSD